MRIANPADVFHLIGQRFQVFFSAAAIIDIFEHLASPGQPISAGRTKPAGFLSKKPYLEERISIFRKACKDIRIHVEIDAGHWIMYEKPDSFNNLIKVIIN